MAGSIDDAASPAPPTISRENSGDLKQGSPQVAHTLTACVRCRQRKTRCDPGLPRCGPCERTNSHCEYFDQAKGRKIPRNYVVHLQNKVRELERQLASLEKDDVEQDPEDVLRGGASIRIHEHDESKFLGPSSGIAITRLVMQLAKQFTNSASISEIVSKSRAQYIKERFQEEGDAVPTKAYPIIADVAAMDLPQRELTDLLVELFLVKVIAMYPFLHEQTVRQDVIDIYNGSTDPYQNFQLRMVIAVSIQRMETRWAGLADSYYLDALQYLEETVKLMNVKTIQCFCFFAVYSLLTPTRTAVYYVIGLAGRLVQALGLTEEKTLVLGANGGEANPLEIDMRRRVYWSLMVMDFGLAHSLGRPSCFSMSLDHMDVGFYHMVDDEYITKDGIIESAPRSLKKWISIHFFRMRLLQLEIRRMLYLKKRAEPKDDSDPWFKQMEDKLVHWRDASPEADADSGLNKVWFIGRYNTMRVFLFRPSPQVPRPSLRAARECYDACQYNIYMHREQIATRSVELTWIFTQSIFMAINTILWTLSYQEIRQEHPREEVKVHLETALHCIAQARERWPGVTSAAELYYNLIEACFKIYDKDGDVPIAADSPANSSQGSNRSMTESPAAVPRQLSRPGLLNAETFPPIDTEPFKIITPQSSTTSVPQVNSITTVKPASIPIPIPIPLPETSTTQSQATQLATTPPPPSHVKTFTPPININPQPSFDQVTNASLMPAGTSFFDQPLFDTSPNQLNPFDSTTQYSALPTFSASELNVGWNPAFSLASPTATTITNNSPLTMSISSISPFDPPLNNFSTEQGGPHQQQQQQQGQQKSYNEMLYGSNWGYGANRMMDYSLFPGDPLGLGQGLNLAQQSELMQEFENGEMNGMIENMIQKSNAIFYPQGRGVQ